MYVLGNNFLLMYVLVTAATSVANIASSTTHTTSGKIYLQYLLNFTEAGINVRRVKKEGWCYVLLMLYMDIAILASIRYVVRISTLLSYLS